MLMLFAGVAAAQTPALMISPEVVPIGSPFNVTASGLTPNTTYTLAIVNAANDENVFETQSTSNASGRIALNLTSDAETDEPGTYRIELRTGDTVVIDKDFEIQPEGEPTEEPSEAGNANLYVFPTEGVVGTAFEILVSRLEAGQLVEVTIEDPNGEDAYTTERSASDEGAIEVNIFTETSDAPGTYTVIARSGSSVTETTFELTALGGRDGQVTIYAGDS
ncbi:hydroxyisourate hydrolase [bacterium]|nr:hydroxyisourate hydrolase [bacterium]